MRPFVDKGTSVSLKNSRSGNIRRMHVAFVPFVSISARPSHIRQIFRLGRIMTAYPVALWLETRGLAALLTMPL
jgi:hypothetical protein